jgi:hypothetical protein
MSSLRGLTSKADQTCNPLRVGEPQILSVRSHGLGSRLVKPEPSQGIIETDEPIGCNDELITNYGEGPRVPYWQ